ncbi:hypothetical protein NQ317_019248 [Molorchus minor]|uniref:Uncharacterized protein n=1 Tax=Molorchus minor TaxID=1323400 RepID=A0ABQ9JQ05_9CUCU|nr:hypothetical protein NQ317_019248 [Molorchus minor]
MPKSLSPEEQQCEAHFKNTTTRDQFGRFIVNIPLSSSPKVLGESKQNALKQFLSLEKRLQSNRHFKSMYIDFMQEYEDMGHMKVSVEPSQHAIEYFIPHHGVYKADSPTTKLRVVFNSSCPTSNGISLNDIQLNGTMVPHCKTISFLF